MDFQNRSFPAWVDLVGISSCFLPGLVGWGAMEQTQILVGVILPSEQSLNSNWRSDGFLNLFSFT